MSVRVRFAPSPTGWLHMGSARTALINYLFAKNQNGSFILRVEDTDLKRGDDAFLKQQLTYLKWLGLNWDEGPKADTLENKGDYGPYRQSQRINIYKNHAKKLIESGKAYYCFLTDEEIADIRAKAIEKNEPLRVESPYRDQSLATAKHKMQNGEKPTIRFKVPRQKKNYTLKDVVRREVSFPSDMVGDFVLLRSSGLPVYNFACAVDDYIMKISHVFRSEEHLANTLRQMMIYKAFEWPLPIYGHLSLILGEDRKKLSKRHGAVSCDEYEKNGYLPSALLNFLALMGWNPKTTKEVFSLQELVDHFSLKGLNPSPGIFDVKKLDWINNQHLKKLENNSLWSILNPYFIKEGFKFPVVSESWWKDALSSLKDSFSSIKEAIELFRFLSEKHFKVHEDAKEVLSWPSTLVVLKMWESFLSSHPEEFISKEVFSKICKKIQEEKTVKGKSLFMPIRVAVLGCPQGAELKVIVPLIRREVLLQRVKKLLSI